MKPTAQMHAPSWPLALLGTAVFLASAAPLNRQAAPEAAATSTIAITFDDLPYSLSWSPLAEIEQANQRILQVLQSESIPAIGFVNEIKLEVRGEQQARTAVLQSWLDAGQQLGNHTYSHFPLQTTPLEDYQADVLRGEVVTRRLMEAGGLEPRYFRHPYTQTGATLEVRDALESFLKRHGYRVAPFTIENSDYVFSRLYRNALEQQQQASQAAEIRRAYLDHTIAATAFFERMSRELFGRPIPQILLVHANRINGDAFGELASRLRARGYRFVSLEAALEDPAYGSTDTYAGERGLSWLHRWEVSRGGPLRVDQEPDLPQAILKAWRQLRAE